MSDNAKRIRTTMQDFVEAWESSSSAEEAAKKLGLKNASVVARAIHYRKEFKLPLKIMPRKHTSHGTKFNVNEAKELLAKLRGTTVEVINDESAKLSATTTNA